MPEIILGIRNNQQGWFKLGGGRNVEFLNYDWPIFSERRNGLFSLSQLQHHNVENVFWVDHYYDDQNVKNRLLT